MFFQNESMTAYMCAFLKAHHMRTNLFKIYDDSLVCDIVSDEYDGILESISQGMSFFGEFENVDSVINGSLAGNVISRTAFNLNRLKNAVLIGIKQYVNLACGLDATGYADDMLNGKIKIFDVDRYSMLVEKEKKLSQLGVGVNQISYIPCDLTNDNLNVSLITKGFSAGEKSYFSMLGLSQYFSHSEFEELVSSVSCLACKGSTLVFDYQSMNDRKIADIANAAGEDMKDNYDDEYIFEVLNRNRFFIYEHLRNDEIYDTYLNRYNMIYPEKKMRLQGGINFILAVKQ